jgi:DNA polymerase/3'-5' exonuclease PolX
VDNQTTLFPDKETKVLTELNLERAETIANEVKCEIEGLCDRIEVVGSIRRKKQKVHDIDFVLLASDINWKEIVQVLKRSKATISCAGNAVIKTLYPYNKIQFKVDFYRAKPSTYGLHKLIRTGSAEHNMWLAGYAISKGFRLKYSQGLLKDDNVVSGESEEGVFKALNLSCPAPHEREVVEGKPVWLKATI